MKHPDDGKFVVVQNGQRISDLHETEQAAIQEATKQRKLAETASPQVKQEAEKIAVKQNLYG